MIGWAGDSPLPPHSRSRIGSIIHNFSGCQIDPASPDSISCPPSPIHLHQKSEDALQRTRIDDRRRRSLKLDR